MLPPVKHGPSGEVVGGLLRLERLAATDAAGVQIVAPPHFRTAGPLPLLHICHRFPLPHRAGARSPRRRSGYARRKAHGPLVAFSRRDRVRATPTASADAGCVITSALRTCRTSSPVTA